jgi:hypothetical protein
MFLERQKRWVKSSGQRKSETVLDYRLFFNKKFCGGPGGSFLEKRHLVAEGKW